MDRGSTSLFILVVSTSSLLGLVSSNDAVQCGLSLCVFVCCCFFYFKFLLLFCFIILTF